MHKNNISYTDLVVQILEIQLNDKERNDLESIILKVAKSSRVSASFETKFVLFLKNQVKPLVGFGSRDAYFVTHLFSNLLSIVNISKHEEPKHKKYERRLKQLEKFCKFGEKIVQKDLLTFQSDVVLSMVRTKSIQSCVDDLNKYLAQIKLYKKTGPKTNHTLIGFLKATEASIAVRLEMVPSYTITPLDFNHSRKITTKLFENPKGAMAVYRASPSRLIANGCYLAGGTSALHESNLRNMIRKFNEGPEDLVEHLNDITALEKNELIRKVAMLTST